MAVGSHRGEKRRCTSAHWKSGPKICSRPVFNLKSLKPLTLCAKMIDLAASDTLATPTVLLFLPMLNMLKGSMLNVLRCQSAVC